MSKPALYKPQTEEDKRDYIATQKIKPFLRKWLIKYQRGNAEKNAEEKKILEGKVLKDTEVIDRCGKLAVQALVLDEIWLKFPPPIDMAWTRGRTVDGLTLTVDAEAMERQQDVAGFATYLCNEYHNMKEKIRYGSYPNPCNDDNLEWFWKKFCFDLSLLIHADKKNIEAGNQGVLNPREPEKIELILP